MHFHGRRNRGAGEAKPHYLSGNVLNFSPEIIVFPTLNNIKKTYLQNGLAPQFQNGADSPDFVIILLLCFDIIGSTDSAII